MNSTTDKRLLKILVNDDFINYVLNPNLLLKEKWEDYFDTHPDEIPLINEAKQILLGKSYPKELTEKEALDLKYRILEKCGIVLC